MKIYELAAGRVTPGTLVQKFELTGGTAIPAVLVGESGRGRRLGVLPVSGAAPGERLLYASVGSTRSGRPKLIAREGPEGEEVILVLRTPIGFRGSNSHELPPDAVILAAGVIAQGDAGRMGSGDQYVLVARPGAVIRTRYSGRLYGRPPEHIYQVRATGVVAFTPEELELLDEAQPA